MGSLIGEIQPAVKKETRNVAVMTAAGIVLMWIVFVILYMVIPEYVSFDYKVILGGICGGAVAVLNFFLMGLAVQKTVSIEDEEKANKQFRSSYSQRLLLQILWIIAAIVAPCFQFAAGIIPLFLPSAGIKLTGIFKKKQ